MGGQDCADTALQRGADNARDALFDLRIFQVVIRLIGNKHHPRHLAVRVNAGIVFFDLGDRKAIFAVCTGEEIQPASRLLIDLVSRSLKSSCTAIGAATRWSQACENVTD